ncbi:MAG: polysaccharide deacetylase family protein, partial [Thermodesulfobacteriota bacterium]
MQIGGNVFNAGGGASQGRRKENLMRMNLFIVNIALVILLCGMFFSETGFAAVTGKPAVVKWYKDKKAAVSLRFDDNHVSHLKTVVPLLKRYGFRATFMVSPGKDSYRQYKSMWGKEIPFMGHRLGNHTLNHSGAVDLKEADYEIGEATRMIRKAHPTESQLMVFASGGGKKWGGTYWEKADQAYYDIARKYKLIDLYDGNHPSLRIDAGSKTNKLCS